MRACSVRLAIGPQGLKATVLLLALSLLGPGCTTLHPVAYSSPVPESLRRAQKAVVVVPRPNPETLAPALEGNVGRGQGAAKGAASGAGSGALAGLYVSLGTGPFALVLAPILVPAGAVLGAAGGTIAGATLAASAKEGEALRQRLARNQMDLTAELSRRIAVRLPALGRKAVQGDGPEPALRLEVAVDKWGLDGASGPESMATFFLKVSYRVPESPADAAQAAREFTLWGPRRRFAEWGARDGELLGKALEEALATAAEAVTDGTFLIRDFHVYQGEWGPPLCGLAPIHPRALRAPSLPLLAGMPTVESVRPTLRWEAFPRKVDLDSDGTRSLARTTVIRYDLRIWKSEREGNPGELVYAREGLPLEPRTVLDPPMKAAEEGDQETSTAPVAPYVAHQLEAALEPGRTYLWTMRARFRLEGEERVTRWSFHQNGYVGGLPVGYKVLSSFAMAPPPRCGCLQDVIPALHHHRFQTP